MSGSGLQAWLKAFRAMHEEARSGRLGRDDEAAYRAGRDELARALLAVQRLSLKPGETPRQALRVARALQVDLDFLTSAVRAVTADLSTGGFACLLARAPPAGEIRFVLRIPAADPLSGVARLVDVKALPGNVRASFQFVGMSAAERERIELLVFDTVLGQLTA